jgi:hypothetical protein
MISFGLMQAERKLIVAQLDDLKPSIRAKLAFSKTADARCDFQLKEIDFEDLLDCLGQAAKEHRLRANRRKLARLHDKLSELLPSPLPGIPRPAPGSKSASIIDKLRQAVQAVPDASQEDLNRISQQVMWEHNHAPQADFDGLSPGQMRRLLDPVWTSPSCALHVNATLGLEEVAETEFFRNARILFSILRDADGVKLTARGNMNRKAVLSFMEKVQPMDSNVEDLLNWKKTWNEEEVRTLHFLRLVLGMAGITRKYKGALRITKKGERLLSEENAGELYALLFTTYFRKFNLAYTEYGDEYSVVQETMAYSLWILSRHAEDWTDEDGLAEKIFAPVAQEEMRGDTLGDQSVEAWIAHARIIRPLCRFGLLRVQEGATKSGEYVPSDEIQKTPLFDRLLDFKLDLKDGAGRAD